MTKNIIRDLAPLATEFNARDYTTLVANPSPFRKFPETFLCLVGISRYYTLDENTYPLFLLKNGEDMDLFAFIHTPDPTKVKIAERERGEDERPLLETTVGRTVPLLLIMAARSKSELDLSIDELFDEGGSGDQTEHKDSASGEHGVNIQPVCEAVETVVAEVVPVPQRRHRKRKTVVADAGGPSHHAKKVRDDQGTASRPTIGGKSISAVQRLIAEVVSNAKVRVTAATTIPFVASSVSTTSEREGGDHTDSLAGLDLRSIGVAQRFVISFDSSHHSDTTITEAEVDSFARTFVPVMTTATITTSTADPDVVVKENVVKPSIFSADSTSAGGTDPAMGGFTDLIESDFLVGGIRTVINPDSDLQKAARQMSLSAEVRMRTEYNIKEKRRLKSVVEEKDVLLMARDEEIENLKARLLLKEAEATKAIRLRAEASKFKATKKSLQDEVRALKETNAILDKEKSALGVKVADLAASVKVREQEVANLDAHVTVVTSQSENLVDQEKVAAYEDCMSQLEEFQDERMKVINEKFDKLYADFIEMALHLEEKFYPHLFTTISVYRWLLTHGVEVVIAKCLNSLEYLSALGAAIGKSIEKGMQDGLAAGITHGQEGRVLADVVVHNPSVEADYVAALQRLQSVNFSLLAELKLNKDSSVETLMSVLRLEDTLAERLGLNELQPHVDQLMVPIHHSPDQTVVGATALSLSLDVSHARVQKIRDNIANHRPVLHDVFIPLADPFSVAALEGTGSISETVPATTGTTTALATTLASVSTIVPISVDDYNVVVTDDQAAMNENVTNDNAEDVNPFPNVDDAELIVLEGLSFAYVVLLR
ncbi:hypothetical protein Tco_0534927 [Tanacetum coccineum]